MKYSKNGFFAVCALALVAGCGGSGKPPIIEEPPAQVLRGNADFTMDPTTGIAKIATGNNAYTINARTSPSGRFDRPILGRDYYSVSIGNERLTAIAVSTSGRSVAENGYAISRAIIPVTVPSGSARYQGSYIGIMQADPNDGNPAEVESYHITGEADIGFDFATKGVGGQINQRSIRSSFSPPLGAAPAAPINIQGTYDADTLAVRGTTSGGGIDGVTTGLEGTTDFMLGGATGREMIGGLTHEHVSTDPTSTVRFTETGVFRGEGRPIP